MYVDLNNPVGHMANCIIWPERTDDKWTVSYDTLGTSRVSFPIIKLVDEDGITGSNSSAESAA